MSVLRIRKKGFPLFPLVAATCLVQNLRMRKASAKALKPSPPATPMLDRGTLGRRLLAARKQLGWTLAELAERSGVSITTISRAERGQLALGYENFSALARALQMDLSAMFSEAGVAARPFAGPVLTRAGQGVVYRGLSFSYEFLGTPAVGKQMEPVLGTVHARAIHGPEDFARHPGEEFVYVLTGSIDVHFDTGEVVRLDKGDSLYFDSRIGHAYVSVSRQLARVIGVITSESSMMKLAREAEPDRSLADSTARPARRA
jgi:transcriptional regulator with XRE-family HTH domain